MVEKLIKEEINRNIYTDWEIFAAIKIVADIRTEVVKNGGRWLDDGTGNSALPLADSAVRDALSTLLLVVANMLTTGISGEISEWDLPKTTPLKTKRKIVQEADKWNDVNRRRAIELKNAYDVLSRHFR